MLKLLELFLNGQVPRGSLREVVTVLYESVPAAEAAFARFLQVLANRDQAAKASFEENLRLLNGNTTGLWTAGSPKRMPLYDVLELLAVSRRDDP